MQQWGPDNCGFPQVAIYYIYISKQIYRLETHEEKKSEGRYQYKLYSTRPKNNPNPSLWRLEWMQRLTYSMYGRAGRATIFYRCDMNPCDNIYRLMWHAKIPTLFAPQRQNRVFSTQHTYSGKVTVDNCLAFKGTVSWEFFLNWDLGV